MIINYLEKQCNSILEEKVSLEIEKKNIEQQIKEIIAFRELLEKKNDPNFEIFTPHVVNSKNKEKIRELEIEEEEKKNELKKISEQLKEKEEQYQEIVLLLQSAKQDVKKQNQLCLELENAKEEIIYKERDLLEKSLNENVLVRLDQLFTKIDLCLNLLDLDIMRCKIELQNVKNSISNMKNDVDVLLLKKSDSDEQDNPNTNMKEEDIELEE